MKSFQHGGDPAGQVASQESSLAEWAAPYVTDMLGKGQALANMDYQGYTGPLTAGESGLQTTAYEGLGGLNVPTDTMGGFAPTSFTGMGYTMPDAAAMAKLVTEGGDLPVGAPTNVVQQYMNPYLENALQPQIAEARRQHEIDRMAQAARFGQADAYGGSRQAIAEGAMGRGLRDRIAALTGTGYQNAYQQAQDQFNKEQAAALQAQQMTNQYGLQGLAAQQVGGAQQRAIEQEGMAADMGQFQEERDYPYKQQQYLRSLMQGLPMEALTREYVEPSNLSKILGYADTAATIGNVLWGTEGIWPGFKSQPPPSDIRLKENIKPLGKFNGVNIYSWDWNEKGMELGADKFPTVGVIAQEVIKTNPDAAWLEDGYYVVDYSKALGGV